MRIVAVAVALLFTAAAHAADPSRALAEAKRNIASGDCRAAVSILDRALPDATALPDPDTRHHAVAAVRFYSALAHSECGNVEKARAELQEFFTLKPGESALDRTKYPKQFVRLFEQASGARAESGASFERFYGRFIENASPEAPDLLFWGATTAFILLGDEDEKLEWGRLRDDEARAAFIERFWSRRDTDSDPARNFSRDEILRRVAFADRTFGGDRGSLTDRGRVFVLLGEPARVHRRAMRDHATTLPLRSARAAATGVMERWVYFKPQLPPAVPANEVVFSFLTTDRSADSMLQRDFLPLKTLGEAKKVVAQK